MGYQENQRHALVSMTNKDVYHVTQAIAKELMAIISEPTRPAFFETVDAKTGSRIAIATANISSIVIPEGFQKTIGVRHA